MLTFLLLSIISDETHLPMCTFSVSCGIIYLEALYNFPLEAYHENQTVLCMAQSCTEASNMGKHSITRHHRRPRSLGGDSSHRNISMVQEQHHRAWHLLFKDYTPEKIVHLLNVVWMDPDIKIVIRKRRKRHAV